MKRILYGLGVLLLCGVVGYATYQTTKARQEEQIKELTRQVNQSAEVERRANVVQRVSKQMEEIAYQQKDISDLQREEAERQTALAVELRRRAEEEQLAARAAEGRARNAAIRADSMRSRAEEMTKLALEAQRVSERDRNVMDTLSYRTLARSLGATSASQWQSGNKELARMLTNAALLFLDRYKGNPFQPEVFSSLLQVTSNTDQKLGSFNTNTKAAIRDICRIPNQEGFVAVTDYGEVFVRGDQEDDIARKNLVQNPRYNFRGVHALEDRAYVLDVSGALLMVPYSGKPLQVAQLNGSHFNHLLKLHGTKLLLGGRRELHIFDMERNEVIHHMGLPKPIQLLARLNGKIYIFYTDGTSVNLDEDYRLQEMDWKVPGRVVTAAIYVPKYRYYFLGMKDGDILVKDLRMHTVGNVIGHQSEITSLQWDKDLLMSTSMDTHVYMLFMPKIQGSEEYVFTDHSTELQEWVVPVDDMESLSENGTRSWPLCSILRNDEVLVGYSNGAILSMNYNLRNMRRELSSQVKREFTPEEWTNYVSSTAPYQKILDK